MPDLVLHQARGRAGQDMAIRLSRLAAIVILIGGWEWATASLINPLWIARPSAIALRLWTLAGSGALLRHTLYTVDNALAGLALSLAVGVPIGLALGASRFAAGVCETFFLGLYSLPRIALAPLFIVWFGIGELSKIMMTFSMVVFVVIMNTHQGLRGADPELVDMMRAMHARRLYVFRQVWLPTILPWILAAIRVGIGLALVGAVIGELLGANRGLGWYIEYSAARMDITGIFAGLTVLMAVGMALNELTNWLDRSVRLRHGGV